MPIIGVRELSRQTAGVIDELEKSGEPVIITKQGRPVATLSAVSPEQIQDLTLALAPTFVETRRRTDADLESGRVRSLDEVSSDLMREAVRSPVGRRVLAQRQDHLAKRQAEIVDQIQQLFSEAPGRLATEGTTFADAWADSTHALMEGAVEAARQSARRLEEQVPGRSRTGPRRPAAAKQTGRRKAQPDTTRKKAGRVKAGAGATARKSSAAKASSGRSGKQATKPGQSSSRSAQSSSRRARPAG
jgi:prevent-host-death family protein